MAHIQRRGKSWRARYVGPDGRERSRSFARKADAERFLATAEADKARGVWIDPRLGRRTLVEWSREFEGSRVNLEQTTKDQHEALLRTHILPAFGPRPLSSITEMQVQAFVAQLLAKGKAPSTASKVLGLLSQILEAAARNQLIPRNPCAGVVGPGEKPVDEKIFLRPEQLNALADQIEAQFAPMVLAAGYRGLRFGELAGLRSHRLHLSLGKLEVAEALKETGGRQSTTGSGWCRSHRSSSTCYVRTWRHSLLGATSCSRARTGRCFAGRTSSDGSGRRLSSGRASTSV